MIFKVLYLLNMYQIVGGSIDNIEYEKKKDQCS